MVKNPVEVTRGTVPGSSLSQCEGQGDGSSEKLVTAHEAGHSARAVKGAGEVNVLSALAPFHWSRILAQEVVQLQRTGVSLQEMV